MKKRNKILRRLDLRRKSFDTMSKEQQDRGTRPGSMSGRK